MSMSKIKVGDTVRIKHTRYSLFTPEVINITNPEATPEETAAKQ